MCIHRRLWSQNKRFRIWYYKDQVIEGMFHNIDKAIWEIEKERYWALNPTKQQYLNVKHIDDAFEEIFIKKEHNKHYQPKITDVMINDCAKMEAPKFFENYRSLVTKDGYLFFEDFEPKIKSLPEEDF